MGAVAAVNQMGVRIDEAGGDAPAPAVDDLGGIKWGCFGGSADVDDEPVTGGDDPILDDPETSGVGRDRRQPCIGPDAITFHGPPSNISQESLADRPGIV